MGGGGGGGVNVRVMDPCRRYCGGNFPLFLSQDGGAAQEMQC